MLNIKVLISFDACRTPMLLSSRIASRKRGLRGLVATTGLEAAAGVGDAGAGAGAEEAGVGTESKRNPQTLWSNLMLVAKLVD